METKNTFLKIMSIIILIAGIAYLVVAAIAFGGVALARLIPELSTVTGILTIAGILMLIGGIFEIIAGKVGLKASKDPSKSKACVVLGIILMIPSVLAFIFSIIALNFMAGLSAAEGVTVGVNYGSPIGSLIIGIIIPLLYILAAKKGQSAA